MREIITWEILGKRGNQTIGNIVDKNNNKKDPGGNPSLIRP